MKELAYGIARSLGEQHPQKTGTARYAKTLLKELRQRQRFLEAFIIAIKPPSDFNPETAEERRMPYRVSEDDNVASLASRLNRQDMDTFEKIFEASGGGQNQQRAYNIDFNEADPKLQRFWENLRRMLRNPIEYYTIEFELKNEPLFHALVYIFNLFGRGKGGKRFFNKETQKKIRRALEGHKAKLQRKEKRISPSPQLRAEAQRRKRRPAQEHRAEKRRAMSLEEALRAGATIVDGEIVWPDEEE